MQQDELFPKNAFDLVKFNEAKLNDDKIKTYSYPLKFDGFSFKIKEALVEIENFIQMGELSKAQELLDANFQDVDDPLNKYCDRLISEYLNPDRYLDVTSQLPYHGSDIKPYLLIEAKVNYGVATAEQYKTLLSFWHSYPSERDHKFRVAIFKQQLKYKNFYDINSELIYLLIDEELRLEYKYFYLFFAYRKNYMDLLEYREYRVRLKNPEARTLGNEIFWRLNSNDFSDLSGL
jgi:hypothetical protein